MLANQAGILVIDPIQLARDGVSSVLHGEDMKRTTCLSDPAEALKLLETKPCHLIFSEWRLENLSGLDFLKRIRAHSIPRVRNICFIFLTADSKPASVEEGIAAGADDYILKPLTANQIKTRVTSLLMKVAVDQ